MAYANDSMKLLLAGGLLGVASLLAVGAARTCVLSISVVQICLVAARGASSNCGSSCRELMH